MTYIPENPNGQADMAHSKPVVIASNQSVIPTHDAGLQTNLDNIIGATDEATNADLDAPMGLNARVHILTKQQETLIGGSADQLDELDSINTRIGPVDEAVPSTDTANSGVNGILKRLNQKITALSAKFQSVIGKRTKADSTSVTIASDEGAIPVTDTANGTLIGAVTETAPASDTASSGLNGRSQRVAQNITTMSAKLPASLGAKTSAASMSITVATDQTAVPVSDSRLPASVGAKTSAASLSITVATDQTAVPVGVADGGNVALGGKADAAAISDAATASEIALIKRLLGKFQADIVNNVLTNLSRLPVGGQAVTLSALTTITDGYAAMFRFDKVSGAALVTNGDQDSVVDSFTVSEKCLKPVLEITRPADSNAYAAGDCISQSTSSTSLLTFNGVSLGSSTASGFDSLTYDGGGWITSLKFTTEDNALLGKRLVLLLFDHSLGRTCQDNARFAEGYTTAKLKCATIDIANIGYAFGYSSGDTPTLLECIVPLYIPFKNSGTTFKAVLCTKDVFTLASAGKYNIELTITANR